MAHQQDVCQKHGELPKELGPPPATIGLKEDFEFPKLRSVKDPEKEDQKAGVVSHSTPANLTALLRSPSPLPPMAPPLSRQIPQCSPIIVHPVSIIKELVTERTGNLLEGGEINWGQHFFYVKLEVLHESDRCILYSCKDLFKMQFSTIKFYKNRNEEEWKKELGILDVLSSCPNILIPYDVVLYAPLKNIGIVSDTVDILSINCVRPHELHACMKQLFNAVQFCHSHGIIHCSIKPNHILTNKAFVVYLIDFGVAEVYSEERSFCWNKGQVNYRAPELLMRRQDFDFAVDIWSLGCYLATMVLKFEPLFRGNDEQEVFNSIARILGTLKLRKQMKRLGFKEEEGTLFNYKGKGLKYYLNKNNAQFASCSALDLIAKMLVIDPRKRITIDAAVKHNYFLKSIF